MCVFFIRYQLAWIQRVLLELELENSSSWKLNTFHFFICFCSIPTSESLSSNSNRNERKGTEVTSIFWLATYELLSILIGYLMNFSRFWLVNSALSSIVIGCYPWSLSRFWLALCDLCLDIDWWRKGRKGGVHLISYSNRIIHQVWTFILNIDETFFRKIYRKPRSFLKEYKFVLEKYFDSAFLEIWQNCLKNENSVREDLMRVGV